LSLFFMPALLFFVVTSDAVILTIFKNIPINGTGGIVKDGTLIGQGKDALVNSDYLATMIYEQTIDRVLKFAGISRSSDGLVVTLFIVAFPLFIYASSLLVILMFQIFSVGVSFVASEVLNIITWRQIR